MFADVQLRRLFGDGKVFADAVPRAPALEIMAAYEQELWDDTALRAFVIHHFALPEGAAVHEARRGEDLRKYIRSLWPELIRRADKAPQEGSLLYVDQPYVVPGGRFAELYYWDTYFCLPALVRDGHEALAFSVIEVFTQLIEKFGHIPNATRNYYLSRSQPPLYFAMLDLVPDARPAEMRRRLQALLIEHAFWMKGACNLASGDCTRRVVRMPDGALLNRYWDDRDTPRDESYMEDVSTAYASARSPQDVYRALRAGAESGWDFSSRWFGESGGLESIRTDHVVPADLNAFLYGLESTITRLADTLCEDGIARTFAGAMKKRRAAIQRWLWHDGGYFSDFDLESGQLRQQLTAATLSPLFTGAATRGQASAVARVTSEYLVAPGGLRTTLIESGEQWDAPNGWAPLQWIAFVGLRRYGYRRLANRIASRWIGTVDTVFQETGWIHEKYDVERCTGGGGGEYVPQLGFGWTNGVTASFMDLLNIQSREHKRGTGTIGVVPSGLVAPECGAPFA